MADKAPVSDVVRHDQCMYAKKNGAAGLCYEREAFPLDQNNQVEEWVLQKLKLFNIFFS